jgi:cell wall-associated NlpC family hydrolase
MKFKILVATALCTLGIYASMMPSNTVHASELTKCSTLDKQLSYTFNISNYTNPNPLISSKAVSGNTIVSKAEAWIGTPYKLGGNSKSGIDCSHFINTIYKEAGVPFTYMTASDWSSHPTSYPSQLTKVSTPQKGDIVIFSEGHAGIYIDSTQFIGSQTSTGVAIAKYGSYWGKVKKIVGYYRAK